MQAKHAGNEQAVQRLQKAIQKLEQEKAALMASQATFAKDKAAWQAQLQASDRLPSQWLFPAARTQGLNASDTYEVTQQDGCSGFACSTLACI